MEKVVVPHFVADWYESNHKVTLYGLMVAFVLTLDYKNEQLMEWSQSCKGRHFNGIINAQEIIAKMYLYGYEVEEGKKYHWRKKKEHYLSTEYDEFPKYIQLDLELNAIFSSKNTREIQGYKVKFNENEMMNLVGEEDFNKLEKVEITE